MINDGMNLKKRYSQACERAQTILEQIKEVKKGNKFEWARCNNDGDYKIFKHLNKLKKMLDPFEIDFMLLNEKDLPNFRKKHGNSMIVVKMKEIIEKLTKPISDLEHVNESINQATETLSKTRSPQKKRDGDEEYDDWNHFF